MQTILTHHWYSRRLSLGRGIRIARHMFPHAVALTITPLILTSCAELGEFRVDIAHLRSDLHTNIQILSQLSARIDELERRQAAMESASRQTQQDLSQAIEVLLRKALMAEDRQTTRESGKTQSRDVEHPESQARQLPAASPGTPWRGGNPLHRRKDLSLGMTQEEVRHMLGEPVSIEEAGSYIFWQYSPMSNQKYVVFERVNGQVSGWRGL
jgi:hypothetical protein